MPLLDGRKRPHKVAIANRCKVVFCIGVGQAYSLVVEALRKLKEEGKFNTLYNDKGQIIGFVENPYMKVYCDNFDKVQKLAGHFGFSPATRKSILAVIDKKENKDDFSDFE